MKFIESNYVWMVIALMIIVSIVIVISKNNNSKVRIPEYDGIAETENLDINEFRLSGSEASVKIVYFYTHTCKFCEEMNEDLIQQIEKNPNSISISLNPIYQKVNDLNFKKAKLTNCYLKENEGKMIIETVLKNKHPVSTTNLSTNTKNIDSTISSCFESQDIKDHVQRIKKQADHLGIKGVPALIINNKAYLSGLSGAELNKIIAREIENL